MAPKAIFQLMKETFPFNRLADDQLSELVDCLVVQYFPKGSTIFRQDNQPVNYVHIIQRGAVKVLVRTDQDNIALRDLAGEGTIFGADWVIGNSPPDVHVEAEEDTFCLLAHRNSFLKLIAENPGMEKHFRSGLTEDKISEAYAGLRHGRILVTDIQRFNHFSTTVANIVRKPVVTVERTSSVLEAGKLMASEGLGCVLVRDNSSELVGIITKKDLRQKVVANRLDYSSPVDLIMSSPIKTIPAAAVCFEAMIKMVREQITHLLVQHGSEFIGIISAHDIMVNQVATPLVLLRDINAQTEPDNLSLFHQRLPSITRRLIEQGARSSHLITVLALMHDRFLLKIMDLARQKLGNSDIRFTRLLFGESGRKETSLYPTYDNGMVYEDTPDTIMEATKSAYLEEFAISVARTILSCIGGPSRTRICASNPRWRQPFSMWVKYLHESVLNPILPDLIINREILDFRPVGGDHSLGEKLRVAISEKLTQASTFKQMMAQDLIRKSSPVTLFRDCAVETDGTSVSSIDIQTRLVDPFVNFARIMAFDCGINETSTLGRLKELSDRTLVSRSIVTDISAAYEFNVQLGILNQLKQIELGIPPDSFVAVSDLSNLERLMLKDTFSVMNNVVDLVKNRFLLESA